MSAYTLTMLLIASLINFAAIFLLAVFAWTKQDEMSKGSWLLRPTLSLILIFSIIGVVCLVIAFQPVGAAIWSVYGK